MVELVVQLATDLNHQSSDVGVARPEMCFNFNFDSLALEVARPI